MHSSIYRIGLIATAAWAAAGISAHAQEQSAPPENDGAGITLRAEKLEQQIDQALTSAGAAGVIHIAVDGKVLLSKGFGQADPVSGRPNAVDTIFGIGSRPIDFTTAAILLLIQRGELSADDTLRTFYPDAPDDRADMTVRHLINGQSGLPDFPADPATDWDADLGWIDRAEFERRTMAAPLLFAPGTGQEHSHWAFGLLAAIIERVSGSTYETFLQTEFFGPAGMTHTGSYGQRGAHAVTDFAVGGGKQVGLPNIPPNWGPTSWLVKGSGGMYSNLEDLLRFYEFVTEGGVLEPRFAALFKQPSANVDGSERGFDLFSFNGEDREDMVYLFLNRGGMRVIQQLERPLVTFVRGE